MWTRLDILQRQVHALRTVCRMTHREAMALTLAERSEWIGVSNRMHEEAEARVGTP